MKGFAVKLFKKVSIKKILAFIDEQLKIINESQKLNFKRYDILNNFK